MAKGCGEDNNPKRWQLGILCMKTAVKNKSLRSHTVKQVTKKSLLWTFRNVRRETAKSKAKKKKMTERKGEKQKIDLLVLKLNWLLRRSITLTGHQMENGISNFKLFWLTIKQKHKKRMFFFPKRMFLIYLSPVNMQTILTYCHVTSTSKRRKLKAWKFTLCHVWWYICSLCQEKSSNCVRQVITTFPGWKCPFSF